MFYLPHLQSLLPKAWRPKTGSKEAIFRVRKAAGYNPTLTLLLRWPEAGQEASQRLSFFVYKIAVLVYVKTHNAHSSVTEW